MRQNDPTQEVLRDYFDFLEGGFFVWKKRAHGSRIKIGDVAGRLNKANKRFQLCVEGKIYPLARAVWIWNYGTIPEGFYIDHVNQNALDNSLDNLRLADPSQNSTNKTSNRYRHKGWRGVYQQHNKFAVIIRKSGKQHYFGMHRDKADAATVYNFVVVELHGEFACFNVVSQPWLEAK